MYLTENSGTVPIRNLIESVNLKQKYEHRYRTVGKSSNHNLCFRQNYDLILARFVFVVTDIRIAVYCIRRAKLMLNYEDWSGLQCLGIPKCVFYLYLN